MIRSLQHILLLVGGAALGVAAFVKQDPQLLVASLLAGIADELLHIRAALECKGE